MKRVVWTRQAIEDVEAITAYVARDSPRYAALLADRLVAAVERVGQFPDSGRIVPEIDDPTVREVIHGNYRIVYRSGSVAVEVLAVHHGARLLRL